MENFDFKFEVCGKVTELFVWLCRTQTYFSNIWQSIFTKKKTLMGKSKVSRVWWSADDWGVYLVMSHSPCTRAGKTHFWNVDKDEFHVKRKTFLYNSLIHNVECKSSIHELMPKQIFANLDCKVERVLEENLAGASHIFPAQTLFLTHFKVTLLWNISGSHYDTLL